MKLEELRRLAELGARAQVQELEKQLFNLYREFPDLFISDMPPLLLKAEPRTDGKVWGRRVAASRNGSKPPRANGLAARWHRHLQTTGPQKIGESAKKLRTQSASLLSSGALRRGLVKKIGPGLYAVADAQEK